VCGYNADHLIHIMGWQRANTTQHCITLLGKLDLPLYSLSFQLL